MECRRGQKIDISIDLVTCRQYHVQPPLFKPFDYYIIGASLSEAHGGEYDEDFYSAARVVSILVLAIVPFQFSL